MKVVHVTPPLVNLGNGVLGAALDLAIAQSREGWDVTVVAGDGYFREVLEREGVTVVPQPTGTSPRSLIRSRGLIASAAADANVLHAHTLRALALARSIRAAHRPVVFTAHNGRGKAPLAMNVATAVICVSEADARELQRERRMPPLFVVRNGTLGSPRYAPYEHVGLPPRSILYTGGLYDRKGVDVLIRAFQALSDPSAYLVIVGNGPQRAQYEALAQSDPSANIEFKGFSPIPRSYMRECAVFCLPSRHEPFGLVLAEAREEGCAIVASNVGGIPEVLDGRGILVEPDDVGALRDQLSRVLDDEPLRTRLGESAAQDLEWLRIERVAQEVSAVYAQLGSGED